MAQKEEGAFMSSDDDGAVRHIMRGYDGPEDINAQIMLAKELSRSDMLPAMYYRKHENVLWAMWKAKALDIPLDVCLEQVGKLHGKTCVSNNLMLALMRRGGIKIKPIDKNTKNVTLRVTRPESDAEPEDISYGFEEAESMGLTTDKTSKDGKLVKSQYNKQPEVMLYWRAVAKVARQVASDITSGLSIYLFDEMRAVADEEKDRSNNLGIDEIQTQIKQTLSELDTIMAKTPWDQSTSDKIRDIYEKAKNTTGMDTIPVRDGMTLLEVASGAGNKVIEHLAAGPATDTRELSKQITERIGGLEKTLFGAGTDEVKTPGLDEAIAARGELVDMYKQAKQHQIESDRYTDEQTLQDALTDLGESVAAVIFADSCQKLALESPPEQWQDTIRLCRSQEQLEQLMAIAKDQGMFDAYKMRFLEREQAIGGGIRNRPVDESAPAKPATAAV
jgi:hypothetical protein